MSIIILNIKPFREGANQYYSSQYKAEEWFVDVANTVLGDNEAVFMQCLKHSNGHSKYLYFNINLAIR